MNAKDVKCPICGTVNRSLDLDETDGWMECESCHNAVQILEYATFGIPASSWVSFRPGIFRASICTS